MRVERGTRQLAVLEPSLNQYDTQREPIMTPAVRTSLGHDLYLTLGSVGADGRVGLRAILTPAVVWIWIGVLVMVAGTGLCIVEPKTVRAKAAAAAPEAAAT